MKSMRKRNMIFMLILALMFISMGYAFIYSNLKIEGLATVTKQTWNVYFDNLVVTEGSVTPTTAATLSGEYPTTVNYSVSLENPGDFYEFTVDVVNDGTMDAMVESVSITDDGNPISLPSYIEYAAAYSDDIELNKNHLLSANTIDTYRVGIYFKKDVSKEQLEDSEPIDLKLKFEVIYEQADENGVVRPVPTIDFATDSWEDIIKAYKKGDPSNQLHTAMNEQTTREVSLDMDHNGTYETTAHLMIANLSKPTECNDNNFSQSACGFVLKFVEAIDSAIVNPGASGTTNGTGNNGGWEYSRMRAYLNGTKYREGEAAEIDFTNTGIIDALPNDLKDVIINTNVISGYGINGTANFETTDKLFLLDSREIYGPSFTHQNSTAKDSQRQLDCYNNLGITTTNRLAVGHKNLSGSAIVCWLRSASTANDYQFFRLDTNGSSATGSGRYSCGVVPVFRIAN